MDNNKISKILWHNIKVSDHKTIVRIMNFIEKNLYGLLPVYHDEFDILKKYALKYKLSIDEILSLRNMIKIQKEINHSRISYKYIDKIKSEFKQLINQISNENNSDKIKIAVRQFFKETMMPINFVIKIITSTNEFKNLSNDLKKKIFQIQADSLKLEQESRVRAELFEQNLANWIRNTYKINFKTEDDIRREKIYSITPDILFDKPIIIKVNKAEYIVNWIDAKNYALVNVSFIIKSLKKQAAKYNNIFGPGAFVFHYGFDSSIKIPNTLILDGSLIKF